MLKDNYFVQAITKDDYESWLLHKHYAKRIPSVMYAFGLYTTKKEMVGVCTFGLPPAENCLLLCGENYKDVVIELNRLIKNDDLPKNTQSWFVARCLGFLPKPIIVISYADPNSGHQGYTYQALNFMFTGFGGDTMKCNYQGKDFHTRHLKDYWFSNRNLPYNKNITIKENFTNCGGVITQVEPKNRYVLFCGNKKQKKDMLSKLKWPILPYPKGDNQRYDASYKPQTQDLLF